MGIMLSLEELCTSLQIFRKAQTLLSGGVTSLAHA